MVYEESPVRHGGRSFWGSVRDSPDREGEASIGGTLDETGLAFGEYDGC